MVYILFVYLQATDDGTIHKVALQYGISNTVSSVFK
jgi:hypothetical protein